MYILQFLTIAVMKLIKCAYLPFNKSSFVLRKETFLLKSRNILAKPIRKQLKIVYSNLFGFLFEAKKAQWLLS